MLSFHTIFESSNVTWGDVGKKVGKAALIGAGVLGGIGAWHMHEHPRHHDHAQQQMNKNGNNDKNPTMLTSLPQGYSSNNGNGMSGETVSRPNLQVQQYQPANVWKNPKAGEPQQQQQQPATTLVPQQKYRNVSPQTERARIYTGGNGKSVSTNPEKQAGEIQAGNGTTSSPTAPTMRPGGVQQSVMLQAGYKPYGGYEQSRTPFDQIHSRTPSIPVSDDNWRPA